MPEEKCTLNELFIEQFSDGELDYRESSEIAAHIGNCKECKKKYDEIMLTKTVINIFYSKEKLSLLEKDGFVSLINRQDNNNFLKKLKKYFKSQGFTVAVSTFSFSAFIFVFIFFLSQIERENSLVIKEIIAAHNNSSLPDEFNSGDKTELEIGKSFKMDKKLMTNLASISPVLKGRFTSIAATPTAKIKLEGSGKEEKGTLFLSKRNDHIKNVFADSACLLKNSNNSCKAKLRHEEGNDMIYWEKLDNHMVFVTDNSKMSAQMVQLISSE